MKIMIAQIEGTPEECSQLIELQKADSINDLTTAIKQAAKEGRVTLNVK